MTEREMMIKWVQAWKEAGPWLEEVRQQEVREADNVLGLAPRGAAPTRVVWLD